MLVFSGHSDAILWQVFSVCFGCGPFSCHNSESEMEDE